MSIYLQLFKFLALAPIFVLSTGVMFREFGESYLLLRVLAGGMALLAGGLVIAELAKMFAGGAV